MICNYDKKVVESFDNLRKVSDSLNKVVDFLVINYSNLVFIEFNFINKYFC